MTSHYRKFVAVAAAFTAGAVGIYSTDRKDERDAASVNELSLKNSFKKKTIVFDKNYESAIKKSLTAVKRAKTELGLPGIVVGVSVDGQTVWAQGFGFANVETATPCNSRTKMRIASISKPITIALLAQLMESGAIDIDKPIQEYVKYFPKKKFKGENVTITARMLACHKSGVRHYKMNENDDNDGGPEFYLKERFKNVEESVNLFKDDDLLFKPGEDFKYTTHGYTLLSAVIEGARNIPFEKQFRALLETLDMTDTHLDEISHLIYGRASYYFRNKNGKLENAALTDNSYKWAGGGLVSNVEDLLKFANTMLYSYQQRVGDKKGFLKADTVKELWTLNNNTQQMSWSADSRYGLGWTVSPYKPSWFGSNERQRFHVGHGGGAVGASSILVIYPTPSTETPPSGVSIAIITNLQNVGLHKLSNEIAENFISK